MAKLFVGNLAFEVTAADLRTAFAVYGEVTSAEVVTDRWSGTSRGFGFVEMPSRAQAAAAIQGLNSSDLKGREINVDLARPRNQRAAREEGSRGWAVVGAGRDRW